MAFNMLCKHGIFADAFFYAYYKAYVTRYLFVCQIFKQLKFVILILTHLEQRGIDLQQYENSRI